MSTVDFARAPPFARKEMTTTKSITYLTFLSLLALPAAAHATALHDYLDAPDDNFAYTTDSNIFDLETFTRAYTLRMTSQAYRDPCEVDTVLWTHWVTIVVPEWDWLLGSTKPTALLFIDGGNITDPLPTVDPSFRLLAAGTRTVVVLLQGVPNQPLLFADETTARTEDEIIAYTWNKFLQGGDSFWPLQLPMVKSTVKCMDAVQQFAQDTAGKTVTNFVVAGGSKRGWTAWLTAAVDLRVSALAPIVSDLLNMSRSFPHHWACYGFWAPALQPYQDMNIFDALATPRGEQLIEIVDPYQYRPDLNLPKFIINAAGDDFFVMDSIQFYLDALPGETYLRHVPNTNHYLDGVEEDVLNSVLPYYHAFLNNQPRPHFTWTLLPDGSITISIDPLNPPKAVNLWQAHNPNTRDFRFDTIGLAWQSSPLPPQPDGTYLAQVPHPNQGWTAFFAELVFESSFQDPGSYDYHFTTELTTIPQTRPFEADFTRDTLTDPADLVALTQLWLDDVEFYDLYPRRLGNDALDLGEFSLLAHHWLQQN